jgi:alpha-tubulin suppressor-like RCC1 family protein
MPIKACQGCLKDQFFTTAEAIDCFTGKELFVWGRNTSGNLGDNTAVSKSVPVQTVSCGTNWKYIEASAAGSGVKPSTSAGIKADGTLWMWGSNINGILGTNNIIDQSSPVQTVSGGTNWKDISLSSGGAAASIKTDGTLWLWGDNTEGQLGTEDRIYRSSPVQTISCGTNWKNIDVSSPLHSAGIKTDGTLWLWGLGDRGELGVNLSGGFSRRSSPIQTISGGTNWQSVSTSAFITLATKTDGTIWSWGRNDYGQLGLDDIVNRSTPTQMASNGTMWRSVSSGPFHSAGIKTDGTLWTWGRNIDSGFLGDSTAISKSSPVQTISGGTNWRLVRTAHFNTRAIKTDGTLWLWGNGFAGLNGNEDLFSKSSPVQTVTGGTNWKTVSSGSYAAGAIREIEF